MITRRDVLVMLCIVALIGVVAKEHLGRKAVEHQYGLSIERHKALQERYSEAILAHEQLSLDLVDERKHKQELSQAFDAQATQLEQVSAQIGLEQQSVGQLEERISTLQEQVANLQSELSLAFDVAREKPSTVTSSVVELERIVVSNDAFTGLSGHVVSVHSEWNFVVIDLGWDMVNIGDTVSIVRDGKLLGKARIERVQEDVSAATLLSDGEVSTVQVNDQVQIL